MVEQIAEDVKVNHSNDFGCPVIKSWQPQWLVDIGQDCQCGIKIDDHCFVVLTQNYLSGSWAPTEWIPPQVAKRLGELAQSESIL